MKAAKREKDFLLGFPERWRADRCERKFRGGGKGKGKRPRTNPNPNPNPNPNALLP